MLGEQIKDLKGKIIGQRVLDALDPTIETSILSMRSAKGIPINENLSFLYKPVIPVRRMGKVCLVYFRRDTLTEI
jgi:hypothetical protein